MEEEFLKYEQALALKELGFNGKCLGVFNKEGDFVKSSSNYWDNESLEILNSYFGENVYTCLAPLYQQAFRFFRDKLNLRSYIDQRVKSVDEPNQWIFDYIIKSGNGVDNKPYYSDDFDSYEKAELECLKKLIEICKTNT